MMGIILILSIIIVLAWLTHLIKRHMYRTEMIRHIEETIKVKYMEYDGDEEDQPGLKELREELRKWKK